VFYHIDYTVAQPTTYPPTITPSAVTSTTSLTSPSSSNESVFAELEAKVETFFLELDSTPKTAFENLLRGGPLADNATSETIDTLRTKLTDAKIQCGRYRGRERIKADAIGADLVLMRFLYKCDRFPIVWYISFYRTPTTTGTQPGQWTVISVRFDMNLEVLAL
jgi:hypothetical protein